MAADDVVALLDREPDLATGLAPDDRARATASLRLPVVQAGAGTLTLDDAGASLLLLLDGFLIREVVLAGRTSAQVLGPGDVVAPPSVNAPDLPCEIRWTAHGPVRAAVLDRRWDAAAARWPPLGRALRRRLAEQAERALLAAAVVALPRVEQRVVAVLWLLAGRWGTMTAQGAVVPVPLTHDLVGRLAGARRSTVSIAIGQLFESGVLGHGPGGRFVLRPGSEGDLASLRPPGVPIVAGHESAERLTASWSS